MVKVRDLKEIFLCYLGGPNLEFFKAEKFLWLQTEEEEIQSPKKTQKVVASLRIGAV